MADEEATVDDQQLVVFRLANEFYGIQVSTVREIFHLQEITHVPNAPEFVEGVINLRGKVVPIIDMRKRFDVEVTEATQDSRIVVVEYDGEDVGMIVDDVSEVVNVGEDSVSPLPDIADQGGSKLTDGFAKIEGRLVILVDTETMLGAKEEDSPSQPLQAAA